MRISDWSSDVCSSDLLTNVIESGRLTACHSTEGIPPAQYYIITVGTPLRPGTYEPRLDMIEEASRQVADHLPDGAAVILRSTVRSGTTRDVVKPVLDKSGRNYRLARRSDERRVGKGCVGTVRARW